MKRLVHRLLALLPLLLLGPLLPSCAAPAQPWLDFAIENAAAKKKPLVVEFYATWCKPCVHFEEKILPDPRVKAALEEFEFVRYDVDGPTGSNAFARCGGGSIPTVVGIDPEGRVRLLKRGTELTADEFLNFLAQAKKVLGPAVSASRQ